MAKKNNLWGFLFASPWIIGFLAFSLYPIFMSAYYSFTKFDLFQSPVFVGWENYEGLLNDELFFKSLYNTFYMIILGTPVFLLVSLFAALLLNLKVKGQSIYRTIFYTPTIVPVVASSLLWLWILNPQIGLLNMVLKMAGIPQPNWLGDAMLTKPSMIIMGLWGVGNMIIIFLASLNEVPVSLYESAEIDGANGFRKFIHITIPWISPIILYQFVIGVIANFQFFTQAYVVASGTSRLNNVTMSAGTENSLLFYSLYLFNNAFIYFKMGKATAMAWILFLIVALITWVIFKTSDRWVNYGGE